MPTNVRHTLLLLLAAAIAVQFASCRPERSYLTDSSAELAFSSDTVLFDTVFVSMGTATRQVKVYNRHEAPLLLDAVTLVGGASSRFRINVDGDTSLVARGVEIAAHDSMYIFVQANINPNDQLAPFLVEDAISFSFNGKEQRLPLMAYGRNAVYHVPDRVVMATYTNSRGETDTLRYPYSIIDCSAWDHTLPHVVFGFAVVNSNTTLSLREGDELYFGDDAYLWVYDSATLDVRGSRERPVLFTSLRHDGRYDSLPGQWGYVWLSAGSHDSHVEWARIENGTAGLLVDTNVGTNPTLTISNSVIENHSFGGIVGQGAYIVGHNLLMDNCGGPLLLLRYGGRYRFGSSTLANYWLYGSRNVPSLLINNYYDKYPRPIEEASFTNCIVYGNHIGADNVGEVGLQVDETVDFNVSFDHCLLLLPALNADDMSSSGVILNSDPLFRSVAARDYHLSDKSPARGAGTAAAQASAADLDGTPWATPPSMGAFEWSETPQSKKSLKYFICTATSQAPLPKLRQPTPSSTAEALATCSKSASTPILRLRICRQ